MIRTTRIISTRHTGRAWQAESLAKQRDDEQEDDTKWRTWCNLSVHDFVDFGGQNEVVLTETTNRMRPKFNSDIPVAGDM